MQNALNYYVFGGFMKKQTTRKEKREAEKQINFFEEFLKIRKHFFCNFNQKLKSVNEVRHTSYIKYEPEVLLFTVIMKNISGIHSMNKMTKDFNNDTVINNFAKVLGYDDLEEIPHYDTINNFLKKLSVSELEKIRIYMIKALMRKRCLEKYRLLDKYWCIAIDGTHLISFDEEHCENCLKKEYRDKETNEIIKTVYYHVVLEAKLIVGDMVLSIATEFIENESGSYDKQDCEIKAAKRLAEKLKKSFPRLPICLLGDSLYSCEPLYEVCEKNNWKFILRFKEGRAKTLWTEFEEIKNIECEMVRNHKYVNHLEYHNRSINMAETSVTLEKNKTEKIELSFVFVTDIKISPRNIEQIFNAGRSRWKIENQGFNNQKNIRYDITHMCCFDNQAMKNHYLLVQISDIIRQLLEHGSAAIKGLKLGIKEISSRILESFRRDPLTSEDISNLKQHIKIRDL
jgi:hypothetical protein